MEWALCDLTSCLESLLFVVSEHFLGEQRPSGRAAILDAGHRYVLRRKSSGPFRVGAWVLGGPVFTMYPTSCLHNASQVRSGTQVTARLQDLKVILGKPLPRNPCNFGGPHY